MFPRRYTARRRKKMVNRHRGIAMTVVMVMIAVGGILAALHILLVAPCTATGKPGANRAGSLDLVHKGGSERCLWAWFKE